MSVSDDLKTLGYLEAKETILRRRWKKAKQAREALEREVFEVLEGEDGRDSSRRLDGVSYSPERTTYATIQDKAALLAWALEHDAGLVATNTIREGELNALVRAKLDNHEKMPPGVGHYDKTWISKKGITAKLNQRHGAKEVPDGEGE